MEKMKNVLKWAARPLSFIVKFFFVNLFWKSVRNGIYKSRCNYRMKIRYQPEKFFENYFNGVAKYSEKLGGINRLELIINYIEYYKYRISVLEKTYVPEAQILVNSRRFLIWLEGQLPIDLSNLKKFKVLCSVKEFGHIVSQLIAAGYIDAPYNPSTNAVHYLECAIIAQKAFFIPQKIKNINKEITDDHLAKAISNSKLSKKAQKLLTLPHLNQLRKSDVNSFESN